jgi:hypothetical protein
MKKCSIKRCGNAAAVKGLCHKHYRRLRRNGDATATRKPGRKPDLDHELEESARELVCDRSPRTLARCRRALALLQTLDSEIRRDYITTSTADGAVNVSKLLRLTEDEVLRRVAKVHRIDRRGAQCWVEHPYYRRGRALALNSVLKGFRARNNRQRGLLIGHGGAGEEPRGRTKSTLPKTGWEWLSDDSSLGPADVSGRVLAVRSSRRSTPRRVRLPVPPVKG